MIGVLRAGPGLSFAAALLTMSTVLPAFGDAPAPEPAAVARQSAPYSSRYAQAPMLDVASCGDRLVAVGPRGLILVSTDGGNTWTQRHASVDVTLTSVTCIGSHIGFAVGHEETLLRTMDDGLSWQLVRTSVEGVPLLRVRFFDPDIGFATGGSGVLYSTRDGGNTWSRSVVTTDDDFDPHLFDVALLGGGQLVLAGEAGRLFRSNDNGVTWHELPSPYTGSFFGLATPTPNTLIAFGMLGHAFISDDAGNSWDELPNLQHESFFSSTIAGGRIYLVGADGAVATSPSEDPRRLSLVPAPDRANISGLVATPGGLVYATDRGLRRTPLFVVAPPG
jgi:photosystem II stability/assembly factor-like uncharacterized protein